jgi:hypothetical protein
MAITNRFATSALSRFNKNEAVNEEIMIHKKTSQILIKTPDGDIISFDKLMRLKNHIDTITMDCYNLNFYGNMYNLELDIIELPEVVDIDSNLIPTPFTLQDNNLSKLLFSLDLDCIVLSDNDSLSEFNPDIQINLLLTKEGETDKNILLNIPINKLSNTIINLQDYLESTQIATDYTVQLTDITIKKNALSTDASNRYILYSILIVKE